MTARTRKYVIVAVMAGGLALAWVVVPWFDSEVGNTGLRNCPTCW